MYPDWTVCTAKIRQKVLLCIRNNLCYKVLHRAPECDSNAVLEHSAAQQSLQEVGSGYLSLLGSDSHVKISKASQPSLHSGDVRQRECLKEHPKKGTVLVSARFPTEHFPLRLFPTPPLRRKSTLWCRSKQLKEDAAALTKKGNCPHCSSFFIRCL